MNLAAVDSAAQRLGRGLVAGIAGTVAMTVSTTAEMKLRGRPPSRTPLEVAEKVLGVRASGGGERLAAVAHALTGVTNAGLVALSGRTSTPAFFASAMLPELIVVPSLTAVSPPWRWGATELALSCGHHAVYAVAAGGTYRALESTASA